MTTPNDPRRLARLEDIPRAVEKLIQWAIRLAFYGVAVVMVVAAIIGITYHWRWPVNAVLLVVAGGAIGAGRLCGGPCPLVYVPPEEEKAETRGDEETEER